MGPNSESDGTAINEMTTSQSLLEYARSPAPSTESTLIIDLDAPSLDTDEDSPLES